MKQSLRNAAKGMLMLIMVSMLISASLSAWAQEDEEAPITVVIPNFTEGGYYNTGLGSSMAAELCNQLLESCPNIEIRGQGDVATALGEMKQDETGLYKSDEVASRLGKFLKADYVLIGEISNLQRVAGPRNPTLADLLAGNTGYTKCTITIRLIDVVKANTRKSYSFTIKDDYNASSADLTREMLQCKVEKDTTLCNALNRLLSPICTVSKCQNVNTILLRNGLNDGIKKGDKFDVYIITEYIDDYAVREFVSQATAVDVQIKGTLITLATPLKKTMKPQDIQVIRKRAVTMAASGD